jgi:hypothetical protein
LSYLLVRCVGWAIGERRRVNQQLDELVEKARRGEPPVF